VKCSTFRAVAAASREWDPVAEHRVVSGPPDAGFGLEKTGKSVGADEGPAGSFRLTLDITYGQD
jgi:hypothetical protein